MNIAIVKRSCEQPNKIFNFFRKLIRLIVVSGAGAGATKLGRLLSTKSFLSLPSSCDVNLAEREDTGRMSARRMSDSDSGNEVTVISDSRVKVSNNVPVFVRWRLQDFFKEVRDWSWAK